jgi:deoxyribodipyrimidine photo-lyase
VLTQWPPASAALLAAESAALAALPIDHTVVRRRRCAAARWPRAPRAWPRSSPSGWRRYGDKRSDQPADAASGLSPYLHFGHVGAHQMIDAVLRSCSWDPSRLAPTANGARAGYWGVPAGAESFVDELLTWRELGYNYTWFIATTTRTTSRCPTGPATLDEHAAIRASTSTRSSSSPRRHPRSGVERGAVAAA